jgi:hypothetical protein
VKSERWKNLIATKERSRKLTEDHKGHEERDYFLQKLTKETKVLAGLGFGLAMVE